MPNIKFNLKTRTRRFDASLKTEAWALNFYGVCVKSCDRFDVHSDGRVCSGFDAPVSVFVHKRISRAEALGTPIFEPYAAEQERDSLHVTAPESEDDKPLFHVTVYVPPDDFDRLSAIDLRKEKIALTVDNGIFGQGEALVYGPGPDGCDRDWFVNRQPYQWLDSFYFEIVSSSPEGATVAKPVADKESDSSDDQGYCADVARVTDQIAQLETTIFKIAVGFGVLLALLAIFQ